MVLNLKNLEIATKFTRSRFFLGPKVQVSTA